MDTPPARNTRSRSKMSSSATPNGSSSPLSSSFTAAEQTSTTPSKTPTSSRTTPTTRNPPFLPTPLEATFLAAYPVLLVFGTLFSLLSPDVRNAPYDALSQTHQQDPRLAPSYFARKNNLFNVVFVKRGWAWISAAFLVFAATHPALAAGRRRARAAVRWALVTAWWFFVTQWFFGPTIIDRSFRFTGGKCEVARVEVAQGDPSKADFVTAVACKAAGGRWSGGHDISGHVFLLVLGSYFLLQEVGWVYVGWRGRRREERSVVMHDGAVKSASVERAADAPASDAGGGDALGLGARFAGAVIVLSWWMLLMTAIYFHTWFEKLTGLLVALTGLYTVYILPRFIPALRNIVGLPGI